MPPPVPPRVHFTNEGHYTTPNPCEDQDLLARSRAAARAGEAGVQDDGEEQKVIRDDPNFYTDVVDGPSANSTVITHTDRFVMRRPMGTEHPGVHLENKGVGAFTVVYTPDGTKLDGTPKRGKIWLCFNNTDGTIINEPIKCYKARGDPSRRRYMLAEEPLMQGDSICGIIQNFNNLRSNLGRHLQSEYPKCKLTRPFLPDGASDDRHDESVLEEMIAAVEPSSKSRKKLEAGAAQAERLGQNGGA